MRIDEIQVAAANLRDSIFKSLKLFDAETDHLRPTVTIDWMDVTQFNDQRVMYEPVVRVEVKVYV